MPKEQVLQNLGDGFYIYLGVLEADQIKIEDMKKVRKEYYQRIRKVLESKLNGENTVKALNTWAVTAVLYTAEIIHWSSDEFK